MKKLLCICAALLLLGGCEITSDSAGDLKDVELVAALAVDQADDGLRAEVQLLHRDRALERQYAESYYQLAAEGDDLAAAISNLYRMGARQLNFSHALELVIGEQAADPQNWLDYAVLSPQLRPTLYPVIAQSSAAELLDAGDEVLSPSYLLDNALEPLGSGYAGARAISLQEFLTALCQPGIAPALPYAVKDEGIKLAGLAVYDGAAWQVIPEGDSVLAWRLLIRAKHVRGEVISLADGVSLNITSVRVSETASGAELTIDIKLKAEVLANPRDIDPAQMEQDLLARIAAALDSGLAESRSRSLDFLGLGRTLWRQQPAVWQQLAASDYLQQIKVNFKLAAEIEREQI